MATPLKDLYNEKFFKLFSVVASNHLSDFKDKVFMDMIFNKEWGQMELKERMKWSAICLRSFLNEDYEIAAAELTDLTLGLSRADFYETSVEFMLLPTIIENYGVDHFEASVKAMTIITTFITCEFAVRPFYIKYPEQMLEQTLLWSKDENFKVRRLSSEGIRPMLPWAMGLPAYKNDPSDIIPILENLKDDPEEFVRRSVANNLNDISKNQPELVLEIADRWFGRNDNCNRLVKHALRTLLKQGNSRALAHFGYAELKNLVFSDFKVSTPKAKIGNAVSFQFSLKNKASNASQIRLEYAIYYLKANGSHSKKVFKISEREMEANRQIEIQKNHSFRVITTRVFYPGPHKVSIIINGNEFENQDFELIS